MIKEKEAVRLKKWLDKMMSEQQVPNHDSTSEENSEEKPIVMG